MANIVINSKYKGKSFEEMIKPLAMYTDEYNDIEAGLSDLSTKSNVWDRLANAQDSPNAYNLYKGYSNDLAKAADSLAKQRLNPTSRKQLLDMKSRYSKEIIPIENAYTKKEKYTEEQRQASMKDSTLRFDKIAANTSLDEFLRNPQSSYDSISGAQITNEVAAQAQSLKQQLLQDPTKFKSKFAGIFGDSDYERILTYGLTPEDITKVVENKPDASSFLTNLVNNTVNSSKGKDWDNGEMSKYIKERAIMGLSAGIGSRKLDDLHNPDYDYVQKLSLQKQAQAAAATPPSDPGYAKDRWIDMFTESEGHKELLASKKQIDNLKQYKPVTDPATGKVYEDPFSFSTALYEKQKHYETEKIKVLGGKSGSSYFKTEETKKAEEAHLKKLETDLKAFEKSAGIKVPSPGEYANLAYSVGRLPGASVQIMEDAFNYKSRKSAYSQRMNIIADNTTPVGNEMINNFTNRLVNEAKLSTYREKPIYVYKVKSGSLTHGDKVDLADLPLEDVKGKSTMVRLGTLPSTIKGKDGEAYQTIQLQNGELYAVPASAIGSEIANVYSNYGGRGTNILETMDNFDKSGDYDALTNVVRETGTAIGGLILRNEFTKAPTTSEDMFPGYQSNVEAYEKAKAKEEARTLSGMKY